MKFFELFKHITGKVSNLLTSILWPQVQKPKKHKPAEVEQSKKRKKRCKRWRNYGSFIQDELNSNSEPQKKIKKKSKPPTLWKRGMRVFKKKFFIGDKSSQELKDPKDDFLQQNLTEQAHEFLMYAGPQFVDQEGFEISIIEKKDDKNEKPNNSEESDCEILKFVFGDDVPSTKAYSEQNNKLNEVIQEKKEWWREIIENSLLQKQSQLNQKFQSLQEDSQSLRKSFKDSMSESKSKKRKNKKIKHKKIPKTVKRAQLKVINIISLIENEDAPKLFQVPLSKQKIF